MIMDIIIFYCCFELIAAYCYLIPLKKTFQNWRWKPPESLKQEYKNAAKN